MASLRHILEEGRRQIAATRKEIVATGIWLTAEEINARQCTSPTDKSQPTSEWKEDRQIFGLIFDGAEYFARYQFDEQYRPLPVIREILVAFGPRYDSWAIAAWFHFPNGWIVGVDGAAPRAPMHALDRPGEVVRAAQFMHGGYVA